MLESYRAECLADAEKMLVIEQTGKTIFEAAEDGVKTRPCITYTHTVKQDRYYLLLPACAYRGNSFRSVSRPYPPMFTEEEFGVHTQPLITDVPRMNEDGTGRMEVTTGDLSCPCVGLFDEENKKAWFMFTKQGDLGFNTGITVDVHDERLTLTLELPSGRSRQYYWSGNPGMPALNPTDERSRLLSLNKGERAELVHEAMEFDCADLYEFYAHYFEERDKRRESRGTELIPFSAAWAIQKDKFNRRNYHEDEQYYAVGVNPKGVKNIYNDWQAGWVGGGISTLPLLEDGDALSRERALKTMAFAFCYQAKCGLFYGIVSEGKVHWDCFGKHGDKHHFLMTRKHADLTAYLLRHFDVMDAQGIEIPEAWQEGIRRACDVMIDIWHKYGTLGQFVDNETAEMKVGGSASAAMMPAALVMAARRFDRADYLAEAQAICRDYVENCLAKGITNGGPGEILSAPDSESISALLESCVMLAEETGDDYWITAACRAAHQLSSWVVSYDYDFPKESCFGQLNVASCGSVFANVQNKHSAPGLCTLSAGSLLKLYRMTGDARYLTLMRDISHFMVQTMPFPGHELFALDGSKPDYGFMCERVNMSDWEKQHFVGGIFNGSCWCETSQMLTWMDIPGVYVDLTRGLVVVSDHVKAELNGQRLSIENTTPFDATVKVMIETDEDKKKALGGYWAHRFTRVDVAANEKKEIVL